MRNNEDRLGAVKTQTVETPAVTNSNTLNLNFITPTEIVDLPSRGLFYPQGHPLKESSSVEIKQMTAKEEDILTNRSFLKKGIALEKLIESLIVDQAVNPAELLICDRNAIFLAARISAYGKDYTTQISCPACEKKSKYNFNLLEKLENEVVDEESSFIDEDGTFQIVLPSTGWNVRCRALNGADEKSLLNSLSAKTKENLSLLDQLKMFIVSIQGFSDKELIKKAIESMPASDSRFLRKQYDLTVPTLDMKGTYVCSECEYEEVLEVPLTAEFFWPK